MDAFTSTVTAPVTTTPPQEVDMPSDYESGSPGGSNGCIIA
ncbi:hypothetical protein EUX98_g8408 [Antrodiella citrinella]|uniref:Fungal mating-type pheromone n=1 Tax=Antrodiella citrinella TaxID=2447956 RepID=A0A4S4M7N2_9APHY|nr:hypothetical protein EUX98_g8408 [Antrodiella citrinella]